MRKIGVADLWDKPDMQDLFWLALSDYTTFNEESFIKQFKIQLILKSESKHDEIKKG